MSLGIGGIAAIIGASLWTSGLILISQPVGRTLGVLPPLLVISGTVVLLVAIAGLSAFQARTHPVASWVAFTIPALGTIACFVGIFGMYVLESTTPTLWGSAWAPWINVGGLAGFLGYSLFGITTYLTGALSRPAALLLGIGSLLTPIALFVSSWFFVASVICFLVGWFALGIQAIRMERPASAARPA